MTSPAPGIPAPAELTRAATSRATGYDPGRRFLARTERIAPPASTSPTALLELLPAQAVTTDLCSWVRDGQGVVGWGSAARVVTGGTRRFADAQDWWRRFVDRVEVHDEVGVWGTGPLAFASFSYSPDSAARSALVVPAVTVGRRGEVWWRTTVSAVDDPSEASELTSPRRPEGREVDVSGLGRGTSLGAALPTGLPHGEVAFSDGARSGPRWREAVARAVAAIAEGAVDKVVLARDLVATAAAPIDLRVLARRLASGYPRTWVFCVDGLLGATPEMLVRLERGLVTSRVLAGTIRRTGDDEHDLALAGSLARSSKDLEEHEYAVRSVADALAPHCTSMNVPESPFVLHLPNVMHLATDVAGRTRNGDSSLALAAALHPSAAVCGTPRAAADALIAQLEGMDRGRYAGPVGWMDAAGDGEWGIALRSGELDPDQPRRIRIFAGCGIVAGSDPDEELRESEAKLVPMRDALSG